MYLFHIMIGGNSKSGCQEIHARLKKEYALKPFTHTIRDGEKRSSEKFLFRIVTEIWRNSKIRNLDGRVDVEDIELKREMENK